MKQAYSSVDDFYRACADRRLIGVRCRKCKTALVPPRPFCPHCSATEMDNVEFSGKGRIVSYTVIHVAPPQFQSFTPYIVAIIQLVEGPHIPGMILHAKPEDAKIGQAVTVDYSAEPATAWPNWPRYYFRRLEENK